MKLLALKVGGFGPLKGDFRFDPKKVTVLVDENERGKSTLLAAIAAALYGLEDDRRSHRLLTPQERWKPWSGGAYQVELELECEGERYTVKRDFDKGTVEVWSGAKDVSEKFRADKSDWPVGKILLGLDSEEFEKCALVRQGELDAVVPGDERVRRQSTLHARLENAADTKGGDTNATEALQVLEAAATNYTCDELGSTLKVETALQRLEAKRGVLESELHTLEQDLRKIEAPTHQLVTLADEERTAREMLEKLDAERRGVQLAELHRKVDENDMRRRELAKLREEASTLSGASKVPANAEADLREIVARLEEALRGLDTLEQRRRDQQDKEKERLESELKGLARYSECAPEDADRCVGLASELQRIQNEDSRLRDEAFHLRDALAGQGHMPERIQFLTGKFADLTEDDQRVIRGQSDLALAYQTEVADLEAARTDATETLREIDAERHGKRLPGWVLTALGFGTAVAGIVLLVLHMQVTLWVGLLASGAVAMLVGAPLLVAGASARAEDREAALKRLSDAQRRLNQMRARRAEGEVSIGELSRTLGYRDAVELMRDWAEYARLMDESTPVMRAQQQMETLRSQREQALVEVKKLLERFGGGPPEPHNLELIARSIRRYVEVRKQLGELDKSWGWIDEEKRVAEASATGLKERATRLLTQAGLEHDAKKPWSHYVQHLGELTGGVRRYETLAGELIPAAEKRMMPGPEEKALRAEIERLGAEGPSTPVGIPRPAGEIDHETREFREKLDLLQKQREELRLDVDRVSRTYHQRHPELSSDLERTIAAHGRAQRFQRAIEVAKETIQTVSVETHRRWADWMNQRVSELLRTIGTKIDGLRFGEDLDFSVKFDNGQQATRGRALGQLSAGARDQLHLAVRLAVSEYLSRGNSALPLLVDDAFATSDDKRARAGMKLLIEHFSKQHQVIVVTCHRQRHEVFAEKDKAMWADRVQVLDVGAATSA